MDFLATLAGGVNRASLKINGIPPSTEEGPNNEINEIAGYKMLSNNGAPYFPKLASYANGKAT